MSDEPENPENMETPENEVPQEEVAAPLSDEFMEDIQGTQTHSPPTPGLPTHEFQEDQSSPVDRELDAVYDVPVQLSAVLGKASIPVNQLLKLGRGAVVELDRRVGEAIDIYVNNKLVARGEVVLVEDRLGITMTEIIKADHV